MHNKSKSPSDWDKRECGAMWKKIGKKDGHPFFSGYVELEKIGIEKKINLVFFRHVSKDGNDKEPVMRAYLGKEHSLVETKQADAHGGGSNPDPDDILGIFS